MKTFYITTAIDYVNGSPHLGHAYEKVLTDVIARFRRMMGDDVYFLTGTDEHGQKIQQSARAQGVEPQAFVDGIAPQFKEMCARLDISNDDFIRTTEPRHKQVVCNLLQQLYDKGEIYKAEYQGYYSTRQEQFLQEKDRNEDGTWPEIFGEVTEITESNYFFKLGAYQPWLIDYIKSHPDFIIPRYRAKQVLEFLSEPLNDLCISRPKDRLEWGIPLPFDPDFVTYVWFDALTNYYSAVADKPGLWPASFHVIGKDILVPPHAVYWPIMLQAAGLAVPQSILAHGWWSVNGSKMSKSTGNFVEPIEFVDNFGVDALRYFLIREMSVGQDSDFSMDQFLVRYNSELANNLGNLVNRTLNMTNRFATAVVPPAGDPGEPEAALQALWEKTRDEVIPLFEEFQFNVGLERALAFITATNAYIEQRAPWKLGKSEEPADQALLQTSLATMAEALRLGTSLMQAVIPGSVDKIRGVLGYTAGHVWRDELNWDDRLQGNAVAKTCILFPRPEKKA
ncbi:methionine--tRNA ligase [Synoicihabitans lomoniglobus]|uniref:Methionine--tRNA ligase n=1 Tax=Synoicihabitans lomoniglobus TaxID=2909285 RepID=A0AAF0I3E0_9BACT|nr:methionine--tRNA ligase [Opitutaceae bacterium LMO-M01]WED67062.1 methionine--tRNA ligase [Opitutaceae bacterium LMO-M01]